MADEYTRFMWWINDQERVYRTLANDTYTRATRMHARAVITDQLVDMASLVGWEKAEELDAIAQSRVKELEHLEQDYR